MDAIFPSVLMDEQFKEMITEPPTKRTKNDDNNSSDLKEHSLESNYIVVASKLPSNNSIFFVSLSRIYYFFNKDFRLNPT